jgi:ABC-type lipoprotein export system ATPase subunit
MMVSSPLIELKDVYKAYQTEAGGFMALKRIELSIDEGEFIAVIGKSGSGKSTLINMITGIDRPTSGEVWVNQNPIHRYNENQLSRWRGSEMGIIFQFFQLLPGMTVLQNVMLPADLRGNYDAVKTKKRAMELLDQVGIADQAHKKPTMISGGQQQRVAIARALINDPLILVADEPTGNLDSGTAAQIFALFENFVDQGRTILIVTHDDEQARRVERTILLTDGEQVNEWVAKALPSLSHTDMLKVTQKLDPLSFRPGEPIIEVGTEPDRFYLVAEGEVDVYLQRPAGREVYVETLGPGKYFGEMALLQQRLRTATVRANPHTPVTLYALEKDEFDELVGESVALRSELETVARQRDEAQETFGREKGLDT